MSASAPPPPYIDSGTDSGAQRVYDNVQAQLPGVLLPTVQMELWNTVQEFCRLSSYFRAEVQWQMPIGTTVIDFNPFSADMEVYQVLGVRCLPNWKVEPPAVLVNTGDASTYQSGWALLALKPTSFGEMPSILFNLWFEAMLHGTIARLSAQPSKPYSSATQVQFHGAQFRAEVRRARDQAERYNGRSQPDWFFPYFARGRRKN
jgi:hypothetical protein